MTLNEFLTAKRVIEDGYPVRSQHEIDDAERALAPVRKGYWRLIIFATIVFFATWIVSAVAFPDLHSAISMGLQFGVSSLTYLVPQVRERFIPVPGARWQDIVWVSHK